MSALAFLLAACAAAQVSTGAVATSTAPGDGVHVAGDAPKPKLSRPIKAAIPKEAADWEPVGLTAGGDPYQAVTAATLRLVKSRGAYKGEKTKAKAAARAYPVKPGETLFIVAVFPRALEKRRKHFEIRLRVVEGNVEKAEAALVSVLDRRAAPELDSVGLRRAGAAFEESNPGSGVIALAALDARPRGGLNAGKLSHAGFADADVGFADVSWSVKRVEASRP